MIAISTAAAPRSLRATENPRGDEEQGVYALPENGDGAHDDDCDEADHEAVLHCRRSVLGVPSTERDSRPRNEARPTKALNQCREHFLAFLAGPVFGGCVS